MPDFMMKVRIVTMLERHLFNIYAAQHNTTDATESITEALALIVDLEATQDLDAKTRELKSCFVKVRLSLHANIDDEQKTAEILTQIALARDLIAEIQEAEDMEYKKQIKDRYIDPWVATNNLRIMPDFLPDLTFRKAS